jgi:50S ribosomal protein L16 3-hydroxylase
MICCDNDANVTPKKVDQMTRSKKKSAPAIVTDVRRATNARDALLGGISTHKFLRDYWQKRPLLIRGAFRDTRVTGDTHDTKFAPLSVREIETLATYDEAESRLVVRRESKWSLEHGPFKRRDFAALRASNAAWTVLVQDTQHFSHEAHALLAKFSFLPYARIDDLMVSLAGRGGGVGPHVDSYDVFLLQGSGKRCWKICHQHDDTTRDDVPLKMLKHFRADEEWVLEPGDMLYLPPGLAHHGIAESDDCVTWSIGFRAPSHQELLETYLDLLRDQAHVSTRYTDPGRRVTDAPGFIEPDIARDWERAWQQFASQASKPHLLTEFISCYLTQPKPHVEFLPPEKPLTLARFRSTARQRGLVLDLRSRLLYDKTSFYLNGRRVDVAKQSSVWEMLANQRQLAPDQISADACETFYSFWHNGELQFDTAP